MVKTLNVELVASPSAVAVAVQMIGDRPAVELQDTIFTIGEETLQAERDMSRGEQARDVLDANLHDIVKGLVYAEFMLVRDYYKAGVIDKGVSDEGAQKQWERSINRCKSAFTFVTPTSQSKDAIRKAEKKAELIAKLAEFDDSAIEEKKAELIGQGTVKALKEAQVITAEIDRRNADVLGAEKARRKEQGESIIKRVRELVKAGTSDADDILFQLESISAVY
jgi:hypothetical protein